MDNNNSVLNALKQGLEHQPDDAALLLHVSKLLVEQSCYAEALPHYQKVLAQDPVNIEALQGACDCANAEGNSVLAQGYEQLLTTLTRASDFPDSDGKKITFDGSTDQPQTQSQNHRRKRGAALTLVKDGSHTEDLVEVEDSTIYLSDVGGMEQVKKRLNLAFLAPLANPELMKAYGKSLSGGLLLYGPPGCGKTFIARALAGELGARFITVGLNDILDMYIGESERKLHEIFESARRNAPAVLFLDELDAIGQKRSQLKNSGMRGLVNQLLAEMDSMQSDNNNLFILAATNHPWDVDTALRRPGRFDRVVPVFPPDLSARKTIIEYHLKKKPSNNIDSDYLAKKTELFSGADLKFMCDVAAEYAIEESINSGKVRALETEDFMKPLSEASPSTLSWFDSARHFAMFANDSGSYDDLLAYIRQHNL